MSEADSTLLEIPDDMFGVFPSRKYISARGEVAELECEWPHPRALVLDDGSVFYEQPKIWEGWTLTYIHRPAKQSRLANMLWHYRHGRVSGFPWWAIVVWSVRNAERSDLSIYDPRVIRGRP